MMAIRSPGGQRKNSETKETSVLYVVAATPSSTTCHCRVLASSPCYCHSMLNGNSIATSLQCHVAGTSRTLQQAACCSGWRYGASRNICAVTRLCPTSIYLPIHASCSVFALVPMGGNRSQGLNQTYGWGTESGDSFGSGTVSFSPVFSLFAAAHRCAKSPVPFLQQNSIRNDAAAQSACAARGMLPPAGTRGTSKGHEAAARPPDEGHCTADSFRGHKNCPCSNVWSSSGGRAVASSAPPRVIVARL